MDDIKMEESDDTFDHFWSPLNDYDIIKPFFEFPFIDDGIRDVNCCFESNNDIDNLMKSGNSPVIDQELLVERKCSKFGFYATKFDWPEHVFSPPLPPYSSSSSPVMSPVRSPYLTIPPGISPAALLDSPIMLPNSQQSTMNETFTTVLYEEDDSVMNSVSPPGTNRKRDVAVNSSASPPGTNREMDVAVDSFGMFNTPPLSWTLDAREQQPSASSKLPADSLSTPKNEANFPEIETSNGNEIAKKMASISHPDNLQSTLLNDYIRSETRINPPLFDPSEQKRGLASSTKASNAGDGYCWRKYGQKQVKGSEYPRSYYKCNNSNCPVKKKVERSHDGEITEIIYNGAHNHPKPQLRVSLGCQNSSTEMSDSCELIGSSSKLESLTGWRCNQMMIPNGNSDWVADGFEGGTSSTMALNVIGDPSSSTCQEKSAVMFGSLQNPENGEDQDGSRSPSDDGDGDESESKRRKREIFISEAYLPSRSTREPRIILQIESDIDILDDGYRWRKYGQKVVKGNSNPRSYYKCTRDACPVRKHVERASEDLNSVITTYEGKHNHQLPSAKTTGASPQNVVSDTTNPDLTLPRNSNIVSNTDIKVQDFPMHYQYQMRPALGHDFTRSSNLLGEFIRVPSIYQMRFPPPSLQSHMLYNSPFMRNLNGNEFHTSSNFVAPPPPPPPLMHDLQMINNASRTLNMAVNGFHSSNHPRPLIQSSSNIGTTRQIKDNNFRLCKPKEE